METIPARRVLYRTILWAVLFMGVLGSATLSHAGERTAPAGDPIDVTDILGNRLILEKPCSRLVASFFFEEIFALGAQDKIVGWTREYWKGRRQWTWEKYVNESGFGVEAIPDVGKTTSGATNCEIIASLNPDLFLAPFRLPKIETWLEKYGIPVLHVDFHTKKNICNSIRQMGAVLGRQERAKELIDFYTEQTRKVASVVSTIPDEERPTVYIEVGINPYGTFGSGYMFGNTVSAAGGKSIADGFGIVKTGTISPEHLLKANPDIIIITSANWAEKGHCGPPMGYYATGLDRDLATAKLNRPGWSELRAVKNRQVFFIHHGLSRHIYDFVALQYFAKWFFPEKFKTLDPEDTWKTFHKRFLPVPYSGVWGAALD